MTTVKKSKQHDGRGNEWTTTSVGPVEMRHSVEEIGPDEARVLLSKLMPDYRAANPRFVTQMANMMRRGQWKLTAETIKRDDEIGLVDGRRRLLAVVQSGCTVDFMVMRGRFEFFKLPEE